MPSEAAVPALHTDRPERVMVIVAHPDDADFGPAATVAQWIRAGSVAQLVCCTSGDAGAEIHARTRLSWPAVGRPSSGQRRCTSDTRRSRSSIVRTGRSPTTLALREQLVRLLRTFRPDAVLTDGPHRAHPYRWLHPAHRPPGGGHRRRRRRLSGGPQRDGVPAADHRRGPRATHRQQAVPVLERPGRHLDRRLRDARGEARGTPRARRARSASRRRSRNVSGHGRARTPPGSGSRRWSRSGWWTSPEVVRPRQRPARDPGAAPARPPSGPTGRRGPGRSCRRRGGHHRGPGREPSPRGARRARP